MSEGSNEGFIPPPKSLDTKCMHHCQDPSTWKSKSVIPHIVLSSVFQIEDARNMKGVFNEVASGFGIQTTYVDFSDTTNITEAIRDNTKLLWLEHPTYPTLKVFDLCNLVTYAKQRGLYVGVDNTYLTPYLQRPLELHADIVMQSCTKYMNGHSDMSHGALCTNDKQLLKGMQKIQRMYGLIPSPFDCYQVLRGLKTLQLRMEEHTKNGLLVANFLQRHPSVKKVLHPAFKDHTNHDIFKKQSSGHSGIISFYIKGGKAEATRFIESLNIFTVTDVFGGNESTAQIPAIMSHEGLPRVLKEKLKIADNLITVSVGLEEVCDIICDLEQALDKIKSNANC
ncbi:unnamed protein product [Acanthoscelides obtectus]|uniref:cystathionine gamma-lyase n=1 Tax=Acanthoscelides obtectus TaxID=200917 RepID=A0A9P0LVM0_ACAOB|nr:unnamed protein product [Acanthoscelides obtectus]CAK1623224.1 Cystathionine gamma-lyase [Acanthoscelides obtectus]